jgi:long-chain acyl-CoA synthetase
LQQIQTLNEIYLYALEHRSKPDAFQTKIDGSYRDLSTQEFAQVGAEIALGLIALGLKAGDRVAILSETRLEWAQADMGILTAGLISVPVYPTLPPATVEYVLEDCGARVVIVSDREQAAKVLLVRNKKPELEVVVLDPEGIEEEVTTLDELRERGRKLGEAEPGLHQRRSAAVNSDDLATIIYTSGTTGPPKGVMLTHGNIAANVVAGLSVLSIGPDDTCLSFLPLSHIFERMGGLYCMICAGATIAYAECFETVAKNLIEVRPTIVIGVPRFYEKVYARILDAASQGGVIKKNLFFWARAVGLERSARILDGKPTGLWLDLQYLCAKVLVFRKLRKRTGGRIRFFASGGAPLAPDIAQFFYAAGLPILEGYGLTETSPIITVNTFEVLRPGTVGKPLPGIEIKIASDGEILARGPSIMKGYYNQPEETAEALKDGWFHTGDIGHLDKVGCLVITDRKKDLIVTAGGKNVAPQPIENTLKTDKYISEVVVLGDRRPYLVALIVPNFKNLKNYARYKGLNSPEQSDLVHLPAVVDLLLRRIALHQKGAAPFEAVRKIHVLDRELVIGDELTPTLKVKRKEISRRFHDEIEALYSD